MDNVDVYVASSWRNNTQPLIVQYLRDQHLTVYDYRNPNPLAKNTGFRWSDIDSEWSNWDCDRYIKMLDHPVAVEGFNSDFDAMQAAKVFVLVMPCGRSAHLEAGWAIGQGKPTAILLTEAEPELMYKMATLFTSISKCIAWAKKEVKDIRDRQAEYEKGFQEHINSR